MENCYSLTPTPTNTKGSKGMCKSYKLTGIQVKFPAQEAKKLARIAMARLSEDNTFGALTLGV